MASADTSSRLTHLFAASHSLALSSPSVAAHLMSQFLSHAEEKNVLLHDRVRRKVCGGCGSLFLPGWNVSVQTRDEKKRKRDAVGEERKKMSKKRRKEVKKKEIEERRNKDEPIKSKLVYNCQTCTRQTTFEMEYPAPTFASPLSIPAPESKPTSAPSKAAAKSSPSPAPASLPHSARSSPAPTSNTPSPAGTPKKRKKSAKMGLQAMLAKSKQDQKKDGGGPGIMDFMSLM
ncbi:hypothetical protein SAICODRAFT_182512 [Saitoella complicata NRRL Y-17804]|nr:uncharacterized protein SAICODRAFT_182512 [Saitoella complicata NRRL Y-17804]ODQ55266.1 hypothetical protein SAICODRAFT_182512 [Saitoella complicata NRRL Y-17804]